MDDQVVSLRTRVFEQLDAVRAAGIAKLDTSKHDALDLAQLETAVAALPGYRSTLTRAAKVDLLLRHEIDLMTAAPAFQELLRTLFALTPETAGKSPDELRTAAAQQAHQDRDHFTNKNRLEDQMLQALAAQIVADCFSERDHLRHALDFPELVPHIPRPALEAVFTRYVEGDGHRLISLEGEPGNGKTRLARDLLRSRLADGGTVAYIRGERLLADLAGALAAAKFLVLTGGLNSDEGIMQAFAEYVSSDVFPTYVLLDNIDDPALIDALVPPSCRSLVVVTSRKKVLPPGRGVAIPVKEMSAEEGGSLVRHIRPATTAPEVVSLVAAVGSRPLAIVHACGIIGDGHMYTVAQFCEDLRADAASVMGKAVRPVEWTLTWIYEHLLKRLQASEDEVDRDAATLLEFVAFLASEAMPYELIALPFYGRLSEQRGHWPDKTARRVRFAGAVNRVQQAYLLEPRPDGLSMHQLTQSLLDGVVSRRDPTQTAPAMLMFSIVMQLKEKTTLSPVVLSDDLVAWVPHIVKVAEIVLDRIEPERWELLDVFGALSVAICGLRQAGQADEVRRIRGRHITRLGELVPRLRRTGQVLQSPGFRAFCLEAMGNAYDLGECSHEEYLGRVGSVLVEGAADQAPHLFLHELLILAQRALDGGLSPLEHLEQFTANDPQWMRDMPPEGVADFHRIRGEANLLGGRWEDARLDLESAWLLYDSSSNVKVKRYGQARTLKLLIDLDCYSGAGFQEKTLLRFANFEISSEGDALVGALLAHASLRIHTQLALYDSNIDLGDDSKLDPRISREAVAAVKEWVAMASYKNLTELFLRAYLDYMRHGSPRLAISLIKDRLSVFGATPSKDGEEITSNIETAAEVALEHLAVLRCAPNPLEMLTWMGKAFLMSRKKLPTENIEVLLSAAETAIERQGALHFGYEGIMVALLALAFNRHRETVESLMRPVPVADFLRRGLEGLGLSHRWQMFENAISSLDSKDEVGFQLAVRALHMF